MVDTIVNRKRLYSVLGKQYQVPGAAGVAFNKQFALQPDPTFPSFGGLVGLL